MRDHNVWVARPGRGRPDGAGLAGCALSRLREVGVPTPVQDVTIKFALALELSLLLACEGDPTSDDPDGVTITDDGGPIVGDLGPDETDPDGGGPLPDGSTPPPDGGQPPGSDGGTPEPPHRYVMPRSASTA